MKKNCNSEHIRFAQYKLREEFLTTKHFVHYEILPYTQNDNSCVNFVKYAILQISYLY